VILHALKDDDSIARADNSISLNLEQMAQTEGFDLVFNQLFGRLLQAALDFSDTNRPQAGIPETILNKQPGEEVRFTATSAAVRCFVSSRT
jgi:hypothetical protein